MSRRADLLDELDQLESRIVEVKKELAVELGLVVEEEEEPRRRLITTAVGRPRTVTRRQPAIRKQESDVTEGDEERTERGLSLKSIILNILRNNGRGMELKEIVAEVTQMRQRGEYFSRATKISPNVSQALHQLKNESAIQVDKSSDNRNLYSCPVEGV
jgi:hypothetical protein